MRPVRTRGKDSLRRFVSASVGLMYCSLVPVGHGLGSATQTSPHTWEASLRSNLDSAFCSARACLPLLIEHAGNVVLIGCHSLSGRRTRSVRLRHCQHALLRLNRSLARDYGPRGVRGERGLSGLGHDPDGR